MFKRARDTSWRSVRRWRARSRSRDPSNCRGPGRGPARPRCYPLLQVGGLPGRNLLALAIRNSRAAACPSTGGPLLFCACLTTVTLLGRQHGDPESIAFEETDAGFQIAWPSRYRLDGPAFVYTDRQSRRVSIIIGYPTQLLAAAERR